MNSKRILATTTAVVGLLLGLGAGAMTVLPATGAQAAEQGQRLPANFAMHGFGKHRGMAHLCSPRRAQRVEGMISFAENFMTFTPPQRQAFEQLTTSLRNSNARLDKACGGAKAGEGKTNLSARLTHLEAFLAAGLDSVREIRPNFEKFYATLNDGQKKALDDMMNRHRRGRHH